MPSPVDTIPQTTADFAPFKQLLYDLVFTNSYKKVLETGTDVGDSGRIFSTALQATGGQLISIDTAPPKDNWPANWPVKNIQFITADSKAIQLKEEIDLLFLDADHTYEHVKVELANLGKWVRAGGKIALHDTNHAQFGEPIRRALHEFANEHLVPYTYYPHGHGLAVMEILHAIPH